MDTQQQDRIGTLLRQAREARGLSKRRAAHIAGVSESRWRQVESGVQVKNGQAQPAVTTPDTLVRMGNAVGLDPAELLEIAGYPAETAEHVQARIEQEDGGKSGHRSEAHTTSSRVLDLSHLSDREAGMVEGYAAAIQAMRNRK